jgi:NAD(P)-dependent dehydrogenase (short-subunit alcohol dehydrogenase family)
MQFSENEIERFAAWSGDHNPLYVDRDFAQAAGHRRPLVPGMLAVFGAFASVSSRPNWPLATLDLQFHGPLAPDVACDVAWARGPDEFSLTVRQGGAELVAATAEPATACGAAARSDLSWFKRLKSDRASQERGKSSEPNDHTLEELHAGFAVAGVYATDPPPEAATSSGWLTPVQARVLGLCGYLVGMEAPGLRSTFTRARLHFTNISSDSNQLWYRFRTIRFDEVTRLLDTEIEVATPDGQRLASGELRCAVRLNVPATNLAALAAQLHPDVNRLAGKVALVCGGSRGLGADLAAGLALAGCRVYVGFQSGAAPAAQLARRLRERDVAIELLQGDARDPAWCSSALETIQNRHGRLDILILNACTAPPAFRISAQTAPHFDEYLRSNLRLAWMPLATCLPMLEESCGMIACISSSLAGDPQAGFAHYVALKQAVESVVQTATRESPRLWSLIVRPQRTLAALNDASASVAGATATEVVAASVVNRLAGEWRPGVVEWLADVAAIGAPEHIARETAAEPEAVESEIPGQFEPSLTEGLDADSILVSMDALIAAELAAPRALVGESDHLRRIEDHGHSIPTLAEIDHWHEETGVASNDVPEDEFPTHVEEPTAQSPAPVEAAGPAEFQQDPSPEGRLHELLDELHSEIEDAVGTSEPGETAIEHEAHESDLPFFLDDALDADTHPMLDIVSDDPTDDSDVVEQTAATCEDQPASADSVASSQIQTFFHESTGPASEAVLPALADVPKSEDPPAANTDLKCVAGPDNGVVPVNSPAPLASDSQAAEASYEITEYEAGIGDEICQFEQRLVPGQAADQLLEKWKWRHVESARRLAIEPRVWVCREAGEVVAWSGAVPLKLKIGSEERLTSWVTWETPADAARNQEIARRLLIRAVDKFPFSLSLARTEPSRQLLKQSGWVEVAQLETAELMLNPDAILQGKHAGSATLGEWGWRAATAVRTLLRHRARVNVQQVGRFEERHDRHWQFAAREVACGVVRDAAYLNWKYADQPAQEVLRLEVIDGLNLLGVVILTFREANDLRPYRHAVLSDLLASLADAESLSRLFEAASAAAAERNADAVLCEYSGHALTRALRQNGFVAGRPGHFLFVNPGQLPPDVRSKVVAGKDWLLTAGDVDVQSGHSVTGRQPAFLAD